MLRRKRFWVILFCLVLVLSSGSLMNLSAKSNELELIYLDFEIALTLLKQGYLVLDQNLTKAQTSLLGLKTELEQALNTNENLKQSLAEQKKQLESSQKDLIRAKQQSTNLGNTLEATRQKADLDLRQAVAVQQAKLRLWRVLAIGGIMLVVVEAVAIAALK